MKRIWPVLNRLLAIWGAVSMVGVLAIGFVVIKRLTARDSILGSSNVASTTKADKNDVRFVLNWCRLGDDRIAEVLHSYQSARSFTGDHLDAHAIRITHVTPDELKPDDFGGGWFRCDQARGVLKDALEFTAGWCSEDALSWFPPPSHFQSAEFFVYPWMIYCHGTRPTSAQLIFLQPSTKTIYYFSSKT